MRKHLATFTVLIASTVLFTIVRADVTLVEDGVPRADIVIPENPLSSVKLAAEELRDHLKKMSGAELSIVTVPGLKVENHVYVGESDLTKKLGVVDISKLKPGGFKIAAKGDHVVIAGHDVQRKEEYFSGKPRQEQRKEWQAFTGENWRKPVVLSDRNFNKSVGFYCFDATGTLYGVNEFLERLGVRWYMPYHDFGTVIPEKKTIVIPEEEITEEPWFAIRHYNDPPWGSKHRDSLLWYKRMKLGYSHLFRTGHNLPDVYTLQKETHPEYFAKIGGKPSYDMGKELGIPRLNDPGLREAALKYLDKVFERYPSLKYGRLGLPDGCTSMDDRDAAGWATPERGFEGRMSDYVWNFRNHIAKEMERKHPDTWLLASAYSTWKLPPERIDELNDNIQLVITQHTGNHGPIPPKWNQILKTRERWLEKLGSKKMYIGDYFLWHASWNTFFRMPIAFYHFLDEEMKRLADVCEGKFVEIAPSKGKVATPGIDHLLYYVQAKLLWNPRLDVDDLLDEYYRLFYGPAEKEMRDFYELAEEVWMRPESRTVTAAGGFLKPGDVDRFFDLLKRARESAGDSVYGKRIALIEEEMRSLKKVFEKLKRTGPDLVALKPAYPVEIDGDLNEPFWTYRPHSWIPMRHLTTGQVPRKNKTFVALRWLKDDSGLVVGVMCEEGNMKNLLAKTTKNDDYAIFNDDVIEVYLETPARSYFRIAVNPNGAVYDESHDVEIVTRDTLPVLWNPGVKAGVKKGEDFWSAEIFIPAGDMGDKYTPPSKIHPWGINVCRCRLTGGKTYGTHGQAISPVGKPGFKDLTKLGNLRVRKQVSK